MGRVCLRISGKMQTLFLGCEINLFCWLIRCFAASLSEQNAAKAQQTELYVQNKKKFMVNNK